jgi:hypothetical protein
MTRRLNPLILDTHQAVPRSAPQGRQ